MKRNKNKKSLDKRNNRMYNKGKNKNKQSNGVLRMKKMENQLVELLNIHATSGNEKPVRDYLAMTLCREKLVDTMHVDEYGNLLGQKTFGNGKGATVLLSAHMDTVTNVKLFKELIIENGSIRAQMPDGKGSALGADDRAGIAIILTVLRNMDKVNFNGKVLVAFSREEEIGCVGASRIREEWYEGVDLAIVCDRRGSKDIVVGCWQAFCCDEVGNFMENVSELAGLDYMCVEGGISDACTFSEAGVNAINLSCGYYNEHTDKEYVVISEMKRTVKLIMQTFGVINDFCHTFTEVPPQNQWVANSMGGYQYKDVAYYEEMFMGDFVEETDFVEDLFAQVEDSKGDTIVYEFGNNVIINQGRDEIILSKASLKSLVEQLHGSLRTYK